MERREFLSSVAGLAAGCEVLSLEQGERPLAISVTIQECNGIIPRLTAEQRRMIRDHFQKALKGTELEGVPVFINDGIVKVEVVTDREVRDA